MEFETKEEFNYRMFLEGIKNGKISSRKGLGNRLMLLSGFDNTEIHYCTNYNKITSIKHKSDLLSISNMHSYKLLEIRRKMYYPYFSNRKSSDFLKHKNYSKFLEIVKFYLGDYFIVTNISYLKIYYKKDPDWYKLDIDFIKKYPNKLKQVRILPKKV